MTDSPAPKRDRTLIVILAVIGALVAIALIVVFTRGEPAQLDESTPEGVVQRYTAAVIAGDEEAARGYLVPELADSCERIEPGPVQDMRVTLESTTEREDSADVRVLIAFSYDGGLFGSSGYEEQGTFDLVADGGGWLIESTPWPLTICAEAAVK
ncbi:hypothetical protein [Agromyces humatus]|uniref:Lipoprotein LpqB N-terminal domain-containing protein n=1 Tax=Agromyces humatus TaxID=279573 RepID=A0ABP4WU63_9MICO|nr:hypothetical protein [Agromyces humatus]